MAIRNRKIKTRRVKADTLLPNPLNWRTHPSGQRDALQAVLTDVGDVDYLKVVETEHGLMLVDGHLRADIRGDDDVDVVVLDLDEDEQRLILATFDPLVAMAETDIESGQNLLGLLSDNVSPHIQTILDAIRIDVMPWEPDLDMLNRITPTNTPLPALVATITVRCPLESEEQIRNVIADALIDFLEIEID